MNQNLIEGILSKNHQSIARLISLVENGDYKDIESILSKIYNKTGKSYTLGITGPPGAGKSSITNELINAQQIVDVLIDGLNFDESEISLKLESFYQFIRTQLINVNVDKDLDKVKDIISLVEKVKTFWESPQVESIGAELSEPEGTLSVDSLR